MSEDVLGYSNHDWRKHTDDAVIVSDKEFEQLKVNNSRVIFYQSKNIKRGIC